MLKGTLRVLAGAAAAGLITSSASAGVTAHIFIDYQADEQGSIIFPVPDGMGGFIGQLGGSASASEVYVNNHTDMTPIGATPGHILHGDSVDPGDVGLSPGIPPTVVPVNTPSSPASDDLGVLISGPDQSWGVFVSDVPMSFFSADVYNMVSGLVNLDDDIVLEMYSGTFDFGTGVITGSLLGTSTVNLNPIPGVGVATNIASDGPGTTLPDGTMFNIARVRGDSTASDNVGGVEVIAGVDEIIDNVKITVMLPEATTDTDTDTDTDNMDGMGGNGDGTVPEPISAALGLMGLGALGTATRRRR